ncbi:MAG: SMR family transporter [Actinomycetota bacterium]|nr:SMR family transporter [Actinomycetota bacterium]
MGTLSLKASAGFTRKIWLIPTAVGYAGAFGMLIAVLTAGMPVGVAYGIWAASGVAFTAVLGRVIFNDPLTLTMIAGIALIAGGVLVIELGAQAA